MPSYRYTRDQIAATLDHSVLLPQLTVEEARASIIIGRDYGARSCCVRPCDVKMAAAELKGTSTLVCTVIGFPHGANSTAVKVLEAQQAVEDGAVELDMVLNIGRLRSGDDAYVLADIAAVVAVAHAASSPKAAIVKVILENAYLDDEQKARGCRLIEAAGAEFAKTSTGFAVVTGDKAAGATIPDLKLMRATCSAGIEIKAAGGVRTLDALLQVMAVGVTRIGCTATKAILEDFDKRTQATGGILTVAEAAGDTGTTASATTKSGY
jgi:deoxyribose-phosphate aldolase